MERAYTLVELAAASGRALHLREGAVKAERDKQFAAVKEKNGAVPDKWADADVQRQIYGHDCMKVAEESLMRFLKVFSSCVLVYFRLSNNRGVHGPTTHQKF